METKRKELEEKRKSFLVETPGGLELTLDEQKVCPGELQVTKELLGLPLFHLEVTKEEETLPLCLETMTLA